MEVNSNYKKSWKSIIDNFDLVKNKINSFNTIFNNIEKKRKFYLNKTIAIETNKLWKKYGLKKQYALKNVDLKIYEGDIHALIGRNGAGKTTFMKILVGAIYPSRGNAYVFSKKVSNVNVKKYFGYVPEKDIFKQYPDSVFTFLESLALLNGVKKEDLKTRIDEVVAFMEIEDLISLKPKSFSSGQKKKVLIAQALLSRPKILILDEPTANLDPSIRMTILKKLKDLVKYRNMTILISSHILSELQDFVSGWTIIDEGRILLNNSFGKFFSNITTYVLITNNNTKAFQFLKGKYKVKNDIFNNKIYIQLSSIKEEESLIKQIFKLPITIISFNKKDTSLEHHFNTLMEEARKEDEK